MCHAFAEPGGHDLRRVRDREAPGSNPGPPTIFELEIYDFGACLDQPCLSRVTDLLGTPQQQLSKVAVVTRSVLVHHQREAACPFAWVRRGVRLSLPRRGDGWPHRIYAASDGLTILHALGSFAQTASSYVWAAGSADAMARQPVRLRRSPTG